MVEQASPNASCQCLFPPGELQLPSVSPGDSLRSEGGFAQGSFKLLPVLCPGSCQILCEPTKSGISILLSSLGLPKVRPHWSSKLYIWGLVFPVQDPWVGVAWCGTWIPFSSKRTSAIVTSLPFVSYLPGAWVSILPIWLTVFHYLYLYGNSFLLPSELFS